MLPTLIRRLAPALAAALLAACASPPAPTPAAHAEPARTPASGVVLARDARFVVYQPGDEDTLASIAQRFLGDAKRAWTIRAANEDAEPRPGQPIVVPLGASRPGGVGVQSYQVVPILCYHRFGPVAAKMVVTPANFAAQLDWLAANGYQVVPLARLEGWLEGRDALPPNAVVITVDDGYESFHRHAWPLLKARGLPATLFAYTDFVGAGGGLSWAQLQELAGSGLVDVQTHSKTHRDLSLRESRENDARYKQALATEAHVPHEMFEKRLGVPQRFFAYPFGAANDAVLEAIGREHYELGLTVSPGPNPFWAQPFMLRRTMIFGEYDLAAFKARVQTSRPLAVKP